MSAGKEPDMDVQGAKLAAMCMYGNWSDKSRFGGTHSDFPFWLWKISICETRAAFDTELGLVAKPSKPPQARHKEHFLQR